MATDAPAATGPLADAALTDRERRVLTRFLARLREELGDDLRAVWLYGSRARGDAVLEESDPDRKSDVDLLVIAEGGHERHGRRALDLAFAAAEREGDSPVWYSVIVFDPERLRDRRAIRAFFIQEVDRDKVVLHGSAFE
jgi:predicted nucleotidyltransferase